LDHSVSALTTKDKILGVGPHAAFMYPGLLMQPRCTTASSSTAEPPPIVRFHHHNCKNKIKFSMQQLLNFAVPLLQGLKPFLG
jgi:hypothetical protein